MKTWKKLAFIGLVAIIAIFGITACGGDDGGGGGNGGGGSSVNIEMVQIPAGSFTRESNTITLTSFSMGKYEVTQAQYEAVMGTNPSSFKNSPASGEVQGNRPVEQVSWYDAVEFCNKLSEKEELVSVYTITGRTPGTGYPITSATVTADFSKNGYRLPTEAQWEYACRAGTTTAFNVPTPNGSDTISDGTGWYSANSNNMSHEVGKKSPNNWGLYDMHGNVWEWCWDWYGTYPSEAQNDPTGAASGSHRVFRGGGWSAPAENLRSALRFNDNPGDWYAFLGFRLVRPLSK